MIREIKHCWCGAIAEGNTDQCGTHNALDRKQARQINKMQVVKPVKKVTEKRAAQNREYLNLRKEYLCLYPVCEVEDCHLKAVEIHHQKGRENEKLLDTNYFMAVCHAHHAHFTEHSNEAIEKGYSIKRTI